jgi:hypothetical protein
VPAPAENDRIPSSGLRVDPGTCGAASQPDGTERVRVSGRDATLVAWSPDYDGKGKAWVRFDDGTDAMVGGSRVEP